VQLGNPEYMAPELLREPFVPPNACTDVFSVAVVLFELLTDNTRSAWRPQAGAHVRELMPEFEYVELEQALAHALRSDPETARRRWRRCARTLELAHDCIVAQRGEMTPRRPPKAARLVRLDSVPP
jgi:serine/threonine protein kinase